MSNPDDSYNPLAFLLGAGGNFNSPEEYLSYKQRAEMETSATVHDIANFVRNLNKEDTEIFRMILAMAVNNKEYGHQMLGLLTGLQEAKFGICIGCSKNHEEQLLPETSPPEEFSFVPESEEKAMTLYNLRYPNEGEVESGEGDKPVICKNCNMLYQSLADRMLRVPGVDGCNGCQLKSGHG